MGISAHPDTQTHWKHSYKKKRKKKKGETIPAETKKCHGQLT